MAGTPAYLPLARRKYGHMAVADDTEAVIDGFTRSACVFAAVAFQQAQPHPVRLAHLLHAPSHLIAAVERDLPCLVTVREPEAAVVSCVIREPYLSPAVVLDAWTGSTASFCRTATGWWSETSRASPPISGR